MKPSLLPFFALTFAALFSFSSFAEEKAGKKSLTAGEFDFKYAKPWVSQEVTSSMRAGQLTYKQKSQYLEDVDLVIYYFGEGQGGGIEANINRWVGQFQGTPEKKIEKKKIFA